MLCKVLKIFEKDENNLELRIKDMSQEMWFINVPKIKFRNLKQGEVIRIRSVEVNLTSKRNLINTKPYTNILKFHPSSRISVELTKNIEDETDIDKVYNDESGEIVMNPVIYTEITDNSLTKSPLFKLNDLFLHFEQIPEEIRQRNLFKVRFYCLRIDPQDKREIVQAYCPETHECYSCKDLDKDGRAKTSGAKVETRLIYRMQMLVKDASSSMNKNFYRILLYTYDESKGGNFFNGVPPTNLYKNKEALENIERHVKSLTKFNVWVDAIVERQGAYFIIRDTKIIY